MRDNLLKKNNYIENIYLHLSLLFSIIISFVFLDKPIAEFLVYRNCPFLSFLTHLGNFWLYLIPLAIIILFYKFIIKNTKLVEKLSFLWLNTAIPCAVCLVLKMLLGRARPMLWITQNIYGFYGPITNEAYWSCPSGHTTTIMSLSLGLAYLFPKYNKILLIVGALIASSRIFLVQHYLSDVLVSLYLALVCNYILIKVYKNYKL